MVKLIVLAGWLMFALVNTAVAESRVQCQITDDEIEKLVCVFETSRKGEDRNVVFHWHSDAYPQDDRERKVALEAYHASVYDYRYLWGRAQGVWTLTVTLEGGDGATEVAHHFTLQGNQLFTER